MRGWGIVKGFLWVLAGASFLLAGVSAVAEEMTKDDLVQFWQEALGEEPGSPGKTYFREIERELLAKAAPDECFYGIGDPLNSYNPYMDPDACRAAGGQAKVNMAYPWGMTKSGDNIWIGTFANTQCFNPVSFGASTELEPDAPMVCEAGYSQFVPPLPEMLGDWRPPRIFVYNTTDKNLNEKIVADPLVGQTFGYRSAGNLGNVVILAGPTLIPYAGLNFFAFNAITGAYLGSTTLADYINIRKWLVADGVLYCGVGTMTGGKVLRWNGDAGNPFQFEEVGNIDNDVVELALHQGRLFVSTWPSLGALLGAGLSQRELPPLPRAGVWMSPPIPPGGLTNADAGNWTRIWKVDDYEPDPVTAISYGCGALASYGSDLYWGTAHLRNIAFYLHLFIYLLPPEFMPFSLPGVQQIPAEDILELLAGALKAGLGTHRPLSIFRGRNFDTEPEIELLYGMHYLPKYTPDDPFNPQSGGSWGLVANSMGTPPLYGLSGFGNFFNINTWTMAVFDKQLFVGTADLRYLHSLDSLIPFSGISGKAQELGELLPLFISLINSELLLLPHNEFGGDLWRFPSPCLPAVLESEDGLGNWSSYGVRQMISDDALYLGMGNPMNLLADPDDDLPEGGWELIRLGPPPVCGKPVLESGDYDGDGSSDIAVFRRPFGLWAMRGVSRCLFGGPGGIPASGDYDADGTTEIAVYRPIDGLWAVKGFTRLYYGNFHADAVPSDYNGDGSCDIGVFDRNGGIWDVLGVTRIQYGTSGDLPVPGDYDGNGTSDIGIFRPFSGRWCLKGQSRFNFGGWLDQPVPGDYDGDGTWEAGIFRPGPGLWAIRGLTRGYYGSGIGKPVPADYNGDGQDDIGIFRGFGVWKVKDVTRAFYGTFGDIPATR